MVRVALILALAAPAAVAQDVPAAVDEGSQITVYLVTMGPGAAVWEKFGHNALWIRDPSNGLDRIFNYGIFSFRQENFLLRYVQGDLRYAMVGFPAQPHLNDYVAWDRSIWLQELNLTPAERVQLRDFLLWNELPENSQYAYDYYLDNCSTRIRDALDRVLGGRLRAQTDTVLTDATFRYHTQRSVWRNHLTAAGLLLALGPRTDRPISVWEEMFLPLAMRERMRQVTVPGPDGTEVPLVRAERTVYVGTRPLPPAQPPARLGWYLVMGLGVAALVALPASVRGDRRWARVSSAAALAGWTLLAGVAGVVLTGLWGLTDHHFTVGNENLFLFSPLALPLAVWGALAVLRGRAGRVAMVLATVVAGLSVLGALLQVLPWLNQANGPMIALALPGNLAVWWVICVTPLTSFRPVRQTLQ
jgi:hypothetical protein